MRGTRHVEVLIFVPRGFRCLSRRSERTLSAIFRTSDIAMAFVPSAFMCHDTRKAGWERITVIAPVDLRILAGVGPATKHYALQLRNPMDLWSIVGAMYTATTRVRISENENHAARCGVVASCIVGISTRWRS